MRSSCQLLPQDSCCSGRGLGGAGTVHPIPELWVSLWGKRGIQPPTAMSSVGLWLGRVASLVAVVEKSAASCSHGRGCPQSLCPSPSRGCRGSPWGAVVEPAMGLYQCTLVNAGGVCGNRGLGTSLQLHAAPSEESSSPGRSWCPRSRGQRGPRTFLWCV